MNVLIITPYYPPMISTLANMMKELAEELVKKGHLVTVASAWLPNKLSNGTQLNMYDLFSIEKRIGVIRVKTPFLNSSSYILRGLSQLLLPFIFYVNIKKFVNKKINSVIVYTPPITFAVLGKIIKKKFGSTYILNVQDIFPQNAIDLGIIKNALIIKFFEYLELSSYRSADHITSHTKTSLKFLIEKKGVLPDKIHLITNWIDISPYCNTCSIDFRAKFRLEDKFIFLFAGVMGPSQKPDIIIKAAREIKKISDKIVFLFVGEGKEKNKLMRMADKYSLNNVAFQPLVSLEQYPELLKNVDVGIVCLSSLNKTAVVPAKILGYMSASIPVVAFLQRESDGHELIRESGCGYSIYSDASIEEVANLFITVYNERNKLKECGKKGLMYVSKHFTKNVCIDNLITLMEM